jgi:hypothetical protein
MTQITPGKRIIINALPGFPQVIHAFKNNVNYCKHSFIN